MGSMSVRLAGPNRNGCTDCVTVGWWWEWTSSRTRSKGRSCSHEHEYEEVCKRCSAALFTPKPQDSGSDTDPCTDID